MSAERPTVVATGVEPIDDALGGLEAGRAHVLYGDAESGKSSLAYRFLVDGLRRGETCALVVRYTGAAALKTLTTLGYDGAEAVRSKRLVVVEYTTDIVDRLSQVDDMQPILDELAACSARRARAGSSSTRPTSSSPSGSATAFRSRSRPLRRGSIRPAPSACSSSTSAWPTVSCNRFERTRRR